MKWIYLSHTLSEDHFAYGNSDRINILKSNSIDNGDSSNNTHISMPTHYGTHIDFPYHFDNNGKTGCKYKPNYFISSKVQFIDKSDIVCLDYYYQESDFDNIEFISNTEILIIKTGMVDYIHKNRYWDSNPGFAPELAAYFKSKMPKLRIMGFDSISLTGRKYRNKGKIAHREFLLRNHILVLEDMDLLDVNCDISIKEIIIAPLQFKNSDGSPVTVFANVS